MKLFSQNVTLECDISIPSESQFGSHPSLPGDQRSLEPGSGSGMTVSPDARGRTGGNRLWALKALVRVAVSG